MKDNANLNSAVSNKDDRSHLIAFVQLDCINPLIVIEELECVLMQISSEHSESLKTMPLLKPFKMNHDNMKSPKHIWKLLEQYAASGLLETFKAIDHSTSINQLLAVTRKSPTKTDVTDKTKSVDCNIHYLFWCTDLTVDSSDFVINKDKICKLHRLSRYDKLITYGTMRNKVYSRSKIYRTVSQIHSDDRAVLYTYCGILDEDNQWSGMGTTEVYAGSHYTYTGEYLNGVYHGTGTLQEVSSGRTYAGEWKRGRENGYGVKKYASHKTYTGWWIDGTECGYGFMQYSNGTKYTGQFADGKENGNGILQYSNGNVYTGQFKCGYEHGHGVMKFNDGDIYTGQWKSGRQNGQGLMRLSNGKQYSGFWVNGKESVN